MSTPLRPRPARALRWNFRRFESASTIKGQRKPRDRTPTPAKHEPASAPQKSVRKPEPRKATSTPSDHVQGKFPGAEAIRQSNGDPWARADCPKRQHNAQQPTRIIMEQKRRFRSASARVPGKPQRIAQRATMPDRRARPPPTAHRPGKGEFPAPRFQIAAPSQKHQSRQLKNQGRNEIKPVLKTICSAGPGRALADKSRNEPN